MHNLTGSAATRLAPRGLRASAIKPASTASLTRPSTLSTGGSGDALIHLPVSSAHTLDRGIKGCSFHSQASARQMEVNNKGGEIHAVGPMESVGQKRLADFDLKGRVFIVTGGASGIGLAMAEGLVEAGGKVYCVDRAPEPSSDWHEAEQRVVPEWGGELHYKRVDVSETDHLDQVFSSIADEHGRLDGLMAAAGVQQITPAVEYTTDDLISMMRVNYGGVFQSATSAARNMMKYKCQGSVAIVASMSGLIANKGLLSPVYNSSKAAVIQLARNLAMEWSGVREDGTGGIRVNCLSPGHVMTPMVKKNLAEVPNLQETWESENMMHRLGSPDEFKSAGLFLLSRASSFMTGNNLVIDGGHTGW